jgi:hypothetical protein
MHFFQLPRLRKSFIPQNIPTSGQLEIFAEPHKKELTPNPQLHNPRTRTQLFAKPQTCLTLCETGGAPVPAQVRNIHPHQTLELWVVSNSPTWRQPE